MRIWTIISLIVILVALIVLTFFLGQDVSLIKFKDSFVNFLPKLFTAFLLIILAQVLNRLLKPVLGKLLKGFDRQEALLAVFSLLLNVVAVLAALSILVGSVSSFITSLGLVGLGITWALQTPILCFTGWILINIKRYYRVGDRIRVNDIYGDVTQIDFLNTVVWEYGSTWFTAEQPSGRLITIPNSLVLQTSVFNYTRDFEYIWDEVAVSMSYESDLVFTKVTVLKAAHQILGDSMADPIRRYKEILKKSKLDYGISEEPEVFITFEDSWVNLNLRYLVPARERRGTKNAILEGIFSEFAKPENAARIKPVYPRSQIQQIDKSGMPKD
jgi:small-conductance mechanosensitive channel